LVRGKKITHQTQIPKLKEVANMTNQQEVIYDKYHLKTNSENSNTPPKKTDSKKN
jgi:hypothetical protein